MRSANFIPSCSCMIYVKRINISMYVSTYGSCIYGWIYIYIYIYVYMYMYIYRYSLELYMHSYMYICSISIFLGSIDNYFALPVSISASVSAIVLSRVFAVLTGMRYIRITCSHALISAHLGVDVYMYTCMYPSARY